MKFPYRFRVLVLIFFLILITYLDRVCISLVGVRIKKEFNLTNGQFGLVLGAFALAYALFEIPSGMLGDRIGQRAVFIRIVLWWSLFTALTGATTGLLSLICVRFLFGLGESGAYPNSSAVIANWFPVNETGKGISAITIGANTGAALAPFLVIPLAIRFGWRAPFFINAFLGAIWVLVCVRWFRNSPAEKVGISRKELLYIEENRRVRKKIHSIPWSSVFRSRNLLFLALMWACSQWANYFFIAWMPVFLQEGRNFSENEMKLVTSLVFFVSIASALSAGILSDWLFRKRGLKFARRSIGFCSMVMMAALFFLTSIFQDKILVSILLISAHFFLAPTMIASFGTCLDIGAENVGTVVGIMNFFGQISAFFLAIVFGRIVDVTHSFNTPVLALSFVLLIGALLWLTIDATKKISSFQEIKTIIPHHQ